jgi:hypothetical protein
LLLNGVAWQGAWDIILPKLAEGKIRGGEAGREWLNIAQDLIKAWIYEIVTPLIEWRLKELRYSLY